MVSQPVEAKIVKTLANGLRYIVLEDHSAPVVSLQIWVRCGGVNENDRTAGVSHFLEHMIFKGTKHLSAGEISYVVESQGGSLNAATGMELTHYYIDIPSESFEQAFAVLAESTLNPSFPPEEFDKERFVILEEIKRRNDNPDSDLWDGFSEVLFPQTPYRRNVIGTAETITAMTRDTMIEQHQQFYVPQNMVVVVAGDVKKSLAERKIKEHFAPVAKAPSPTFPDLRERPRSTAKIKDIRRTAQQAQVAVGFLGPTLNDPDQVAMDVLSITLGGGNSSRLYQVLREQKQIVWNVSSQFMTHHGSGAFGIFAECPPESAASLPNEIYLILYDHLTKGFRPEELTRAKAQIQSSWLFSQETYHGQASQWGFYTALGRPQLVRSYIKELKKVKLDHLQHLLERYFQGRELSGAVLMPE